MNRTRIPLLAVTAAAMLLAGAAEATAMVWQPAPARQAGQDHAHAGHGARAMAQAFRLADGSGASVRLQLPDLSTRKLAPDAAGRTAVPPTKMEYYHALIAERDMAERHEAAIRYLHLRGKPSGRSPSELLAASHTPLDIVPAPLPREHWSYLSGRSFSFVVRYEGRPLAGQRVALQTANGTIREYETATDGRVAIELPDDFPVVKPGRAGNRPAEFVLTAEHHDRGRLYVTTLSAPYSPNPSHWQSSALGVTTLAGGLLLGGLLSRRLGRKGGNDTQRRH